MREVIMDTLANYFQGKIDLHKANIEIYLENATGVGEHSNLMETIELEIEKLAEYQDKLFALGEFDRNG